MAMDGYPTGFAFNPVGDAQQAIADLRRVSAEVAEHECTDFSSALVVRWHKVTLDNVIEVLEPLVPKGESAVTYPVFDVTSDIDFRNAFDKHIATRKDFTGPDEGWPWPWEDSETSDYAYAFDEGKVWGYSYQWFDVMAQLNETPEESDARVAREDEEYSKTGYIPAASRRNPYPFPDMTARKNVQWGGNKSGLIVFKSEPDGKVTINAPE